MNLASLTPRKLMVQCGDKTSAISLAAVSDDLAGLADIVQAIPTPFANMGSLYAPAHMQIKININPKWVSKKTDIYGGVLTVNLEASGLHFTKGEIEYQFAAITAAVYTISGGTTKII